MSKSEAVLLSAGTLSLFGSGLLSRIGRMTGSGVLCIPKHKVSHRHFEVGKAFAGMEKAFHGLGWALG